MSRFRFFKHVVQELPAGAVHHVEDLLETVGAAIVWIRNLGSRAALGIEFPEEVEGRFAADAVPVLFQVGQVRLVHGDDVVEPLKILGLDLAGSVR